MKCMEKLTYKQAYDKIIQAYFRDEIKPKNSDFCFCGTLSPNRGDWNVIQYFSWGEEKPEFINYNYNWAEPYTLYEYKKMEWALIHHKNIYGGYNNVNCDGEDALFAGMSAALDVLKEIHQSRGEDVDGVQVFTKRELATP